jgi:stringent starvation protein B
VPPTRTSGGGDQLDYGASDGEVTFGTVNLNAGFTPDPHTVSVVSGGSVDVYAQNLGSGCAGFAASTPDYRIRWSGSAARLRIFFVANSGQDTTLIVNDANGNWHCNDDHTGLDPLVELNNPTQGQIDIWVGSYGADNFVDGTLYVTELDYDPGDYTGGSQQTGGGLDYTLSPNFGSVNLNAGFTPDPHEVSITSGGGVDVYAQNLGSGCTGYATSAPDYRIQWSGSASRLRIFFVADGGEDTTLIVNDANGNWRCNDDHTGLDPLVELNTPPQGQIDVWVGSYSSGSLVPGTLYVTELDLDPGDYTGGTQPVGGGLDYTLSPNFGSVNLNAGFTPDPHEVSITSGGGVDVYAQNLGSGCTGYATSAPDYRIQWSGSASRLRIFFVADGGEDTTLIVNDANGNWRCNDDHTGLDPLVELSNPPVGQMDVWVGSYSSGSLVPGTLYVTELDLDPGDYTGGTQPVGGGLDYTLSPNFGSVNLEAGFWPDPQEVSITSGGGVDVYAQNLGSGCTGYATSAPDYRINWTGSASRLRIFFVPSSGEDTTIIVNDANGNWRCNDDHTGLDPLVELSNPPPGQMDVWVGSYSSGSLVPGTLYITEFDLDPGDY